MESKVINNLPHVLTKIGFVDGEKIADTLQGSIWRAISGSNESSVIKITSQNLHKRSSSKPWNGKTFKVQENILIEQSILKYLSENENCPESIVKYQRFFKSKTNYYLVMEDGGTSLWDFISDAHGLINQGQITIKEWHRVCKIIFKQMIECIEYIHSQNVCHFDISLENMVINDVE
eukprot:92333_1